MICGATSRKRDGWAAMQGRGRGSAADARRAQAPDGRVEAGGRGPRAQAKEASEARESFETEAHELKQATRFTTRLSCDDRAEFESIRRKLRGEDTPQKEQRIISRPCSTRPSRNSRNNLEKFWAGPWTRRAAARFQKQQRPSLGETDQDEVTAAPGWDAMGTRRASDDPELADHLARRDKAIAMGLVDAPPDEWMEEERPEEPETEAERKLRELEERAFDGAAVQDEEAAPWPRAESLAQSAAPWNHARQRDRRARPPPPAPCRWRSPSPATTPRPRRADAGRAAARPPGHHRRDRRLPPDAPRPRRDERAGGGDAAAAERSRATTTPRRATVLEARLRGHAPRGRPPAPARRPRGRGVAGGPAETAEPAQPPAVHSLAACWRRALAARLRGLSYSPASCRRPLALAGPRPRGRRRAACGSPSATRGRASTAAARAPRAARRRRRRRRRRACSRRRHARRALGGRVSARRGGPAPMSRQRGGAGQSAEP